MTTWLEDFDAAVDGVNAAFSRMRTTLLNRAAPAPLTFISDTPHCKSWARLSDGQVAYCELTPDGHTVHLHGATRWVEHPPFKPFELGQAPPAFIGDAAAQAWGEAIGVKVHAKDACLSWIVTSKNVQMYCTHKRHDGHGLHQNGPFTWVDLPPHGSKELTKEEQANRSAGLEAPVKFALSWPHDDTPKRRAIGTLVEMLPAIFLGGQRLYRLGGTDIWDGLDAIAELLKRQKITIDLDLSILKGTVVRLSASHFEESL